MAGWVEGISAQRAGGPAGLHEAGGADGEGGHLLTGGEEAGGRAPVEDELLVVGILLVVPAVRQGRLQDLNGQLAAAQYRMGEFDSIDDALRRAPETYLTQLEPILEGLRKAGVPEQ